MSLDPRLRGTLPFAGLSYAATVVLSATTAWLATDGLSAAVRPLPAGDHALFEPGGAVLIEALQHLYASRGWALAWTASTGLLAASLLGPFLTMAWLRALRFRESVPTALRFALHRYLATLRLFGLFLPVGLLGLGLFALPPALAHHALRNAPHALLHDGLVLLAALLGAVAPVVALAWHDLARAHLVSDGSSVGSAARRARDDLTPSRVLAYFGWGCLGWALGLAASIATFTLDDGATYTSAAVATVTGQALIFGRILARGRWLLTAARIADA